MMIVAIAVGVIAVASISTAYTILKREIVRNFLSTNPAAALVDVDLTGSSLIEGVKAQTGIADAEAAGQLTGRTEVRPNEWAPLLLFVVPDFRAARISTVRLESGHWPTTSDGIMLERTAVSMANTAVDHAITVQMPHGPKRALTVAGVVHDPSLAPAQQEQTVYGFVTPATASLLGEDPSLHILKMTVKDAPGDPAGVERTVIGVADWLRREGHSVGEIRIPPHQHPHQGMMTGVVQMLLVFSLLTLILSAILTATLTASLLAPQVRQIGVMKTIGARSSQIMQIYAALIAAIGLLAVAIGLPLGIAAGRALAENTARLLNLELANRSVPAWLYVIQVLMGVGLPLAVALAPIKIAAGRTVRETLSDFGVRHSGGPGRALRWISRLGGQNPALVIAIRNSVRHRSRLALTLGLLATAGAMFMTSINVKAAWQHNLVEAGMERHFDAEFQFADARPKADVLATVSLVPGVRRVEPWSIESTSLARQDGFRVVRTYPDGGHGSLRLQAVPCDSAFLTPRVIAGHWLSASGTGGVVVNQQALSMLPGISVGDRIDLIVHGVPAQLPVVGLVREHLTQATVYMSPDLFEQKAGEPGLTEGIRVALDGTDERSVDEHIASIEGALQNSGVKVIQSSSRARLARAMGGHLFILIFTLVVTSVLMATVGMMGLGSAMTISVLERTRELAVMRVIGAGARTIRRAVVGEAVLIGALSTGISLILSVPLTIFVDWVVGIASFGPALGTSLAADAMPLWVLITLFGAVTASAYPSWRASRLTIREALAFQ
jgi:putative ABC transport system permease protein